MWETRSSAVRASSLFYPEKKIKRRKSRLPYLTISRAAAAYDWKEGEKFLNALPFTSLHGLLSSFFLSFSLFFHPNFRENTGIAAAMRGFPSALCVGMWLLLLYSSSSSSSPKNRRWQRRQLGGGGGGITSNIFQTIPKNNNKKESARTSRNVFSRSSLSVFHIFLQYLHPCI